MGVWWVCVCTHYSHKRTLCLQLIKKDVLKKTSEKKIAKPYRKFITYCRNRFITAHFGRLKAYTKYREKRRPVSQIAIDHFVKTLLILKKTCVCVCVLEAVLRILLHKTVAFISRIFEEN